MRSIPTSETRTHASMTMPLSSTRSRTSIRLVPPAARSTGIEHSFSRHGRGAAASLQRAGRGSSASKRRELPLERADLLAERVVLGRQLLPARRQVVIEFPPVEANLLRFVDRADQQPYSDRQQFYFGQRHLDVARHHEPFVEHAVENVDQTRRSPVPIRQRRHRFRILTALQTLAFLDNEARSRLSQQRGCHASTKELVGNNLILHRSPTAARSQPYRFTTDVR